MTSSIPGVSCFVRSLFFFRPALIPQRPLSRGFLGFTLLAVIRGCGCPSRPLTRGVRSLLHSRVHPPCFPRVSLRPRMPKRLTFALSLPPSCHPTRPASTRAFLPRPPRFLPLFPALSARHPLRFFDLLHSLAAPHPPRFCALFHTPARPWLRARPHPAPVAPRALGPFSSAAARPDSPDPSRVSGRPAPRSPFPPGVGAGRGSGTGTGTRGCGGPTTTCGAPSRSTTGPTPYLRRSTRRRGAGTEMGAGAGGRRAGSAPTGVGRPGWRFTDGTGRSTTHAPRRGRRGTLNITPLRSGAPALAGQAL